MLMFTILQNILKSVQKVSGYDIISGQHLSKAVVLGVKSRPNSIEVNGVSVKDFKYNQSLNELSINDLSVNLMKKNTIDCK